VKALVYQGPGRRGWDTVPDPTIVDPTDIVAPGDRGSRALRDLLGGKGAGIAEMTCVPGPERVPAGFTITAAACVRCVRDRAAPAGLVDEVDQALARFEGRVGRRLSDPENPLLVSVPSGARESSGALGADVFGAHSAHEGSSPATPSKEQEDD